MTNGVSAALFVPVLQPSERSWCTSVLCECRMFGVCEKCCSAWFILLQLMPGKKIHNTSIENNILLLGLCTHISFVWLFFCLSYSPGGIFRSLQAETYEPWCYILWCLSISHTRQCSGVVRDLPVVRFLKLPLLTSAGAKRSLGTGGGGARRGPARRQSTAPSVHPPAVTRQELTPSACTYIQE